MMMMRCAGFPGGFSCPLIFFFLFLTCLLEIEQSVWKLNKVYGFCLARREGVWGMQGVKNVCFDSGKK